MQANGMTCLCSDSAHFIRFPVVADELFQYARCSLVPAGLLEAGLADAVLASSPNSRFLAPLVLRACNKPPQKKKFYKKKKRGGGGETACLRGRSPARTSWPSRPLSYLVIIAAEAMMLAPPILGSFHGYFTKQINQLLAPLLSAFRLGTGSIKAVTFGIRRLFSILLFLPLCLSFWVPTYHIARKKLDPVIAAILIWTSF